VQRCVRGRVGGHIKRRDQGRVEEKVRGCVRGRVEGHVGGRVEGCIPGRGQGNRCGCHQGCDQGCEQGCGQGLPRNPTGARKKHADCSGSAASLTSPATSCNIRRLSRRERGGRRASSHSAPYRPDWRASIRGSHSHEKGNERTGRVQSGAKARACPEGAPRQQSAVAGGPSAVNACDQQEGVCRGAATPERFAWRERQRGLSDSEEASPRARYRFFVGSKRAGTLGAWTAGCGGAARRAREPKEHASDGPFGRGAPTHGPW